MTAPAHDLLAALARAADLPDDVDVLAVWDGAVADLRAALTGAEFDSAGRPALLLLTVAEPLFRAWAARRDVDVHATADGLLGFTLDDTAHVAAQTEQDGDFLGPDVLWVMGVDGDGSWCARGLRLRVADLLRGHRRAAVVPAA